MKIHKSLSGRKTWCNLVIVRGQRKTVWSKNWDDVECKLCLAKKGQK